MSATISASRGERPTDPARPVPGPTDARLVVPDEHDDLTVRDPLQAWTISGPVSTLDK
jgi:hypothetical protein